MGAAPSLQYLPLARGEAARTPLQKLLNDRMPQPWRNVVVPQPVDGLHRKRLIVHAGGRVRTDEREERFLQLALAQGAGGELDQALAQCGFRGVVSERRRCFRGFLRRWRRQPRFLVGLQMALLVFLATAAPAGIVAAQDHGAAHRLRNEIVFVVERTILLLLFLVVVFVIRRATEIVNCRFGTLAGDGRGLIHRVVDLEGFPQLGARPLGQHRGVTAEKRPCEFPAFGSFGKPQRQRNGQEQFVALGLCKSGEAVQQAQQTIPFSWLFGKMAQGQGYGASLINIGGGHQLPDGIERRLGPPRRDALRRPMTCPFDVYIVYRAAFDQFRQYGRVAYLAEQREAGYDGRRIAFGHGSGGHGTQHPDQQRNRAGAVFQDFVHQISVQPVLGHLQQIVHEPIGPQPLADLFRLIPAFLKESFGHDLESFLTVGEIRGDRLVLEGLFELLDTLRIAQRLEGAQFQEPVAEGLAFAGKTGAHLEPRLETARIGADGAPAILRGARQVARLVAFFADGGQRHGVERIEFQRLSKGLLARERSGLHLCEQRSPGFDDRVGCEEHGTNSLHFNAIAFGERLQYASIGVPDPELGGNSDVALESDSGFLRDRLGGAGRLGVGEGLPALPSLVCAGPPGPALRDRPTRRWAAVQGDRPTTRDLSANPGSRFACTRALAPDRSPDTPGAPSHKTRLPPGAGRRHPLRG